MKSTNTVGTNLSQLYTVCGKFQAFVASEISLFCENDEVN